MPETFSGPYRTVRAYVPRLGSPVSLNPVIVRVPTCRSSRTRVTTSSESPTFNSWPVNGVSTTRKGELVSGDPGAGGVTGDVPVGPPLIPLPKVPTVGPASQLTTSAIPATTVTRRPNG